MTHLTDSSCHYEYCTKPALYHFKILEHEHNFCGKCKTSIVRTSLSECPVRGCRKSFAHNAQESDFHALERRTTKIALSVLDDEFSSLDHSITTESTPDTQSLLTDSQKDTGKAPSFYISQFDQQDVKKCFSNNAKCIGISTCIGITIVVVVITAKS